MTLNRHPHGYLCWNYCFWSTSTAFYSFWTGGFRFQIGIQGHANYRGVISGSIDRSIASPQSAGKIISAVGGIISGTFQTRPQKPMDPRFGYPYFKGFHFLDQKPKLHLKRSLFTIQSQWAGSPMGQIRFPPWGPSKWTSPRYCPLGPH